MKSKEQEEIFVNHLSDKDLESKIYKELITQQQKDKKLTLKMGKELKPIFHQRSHINSQQARKKDASYINH